MVSWPRSVIPASSSASRTVAAFVRMVRVAAVGHEGHGALGADVQREPRAADAPGARGGQVRALGAHPELPQRPVHGAGGRPHLAPLAVEGEPHGAAVAHGDLVAAGRGPCRGRARRCRARRPSTPSSARSSSTSSAKVCRVRGSPSTLSSTALSLATNAEVPPARNATTSACGTSRRSGAGPLAGPAARARPRRAPARPPAPAGAAVARHGGGSGAGRRGGAGARRRAGTCPRSAAVAAPRPRTPASGARTAASGVVRRALGAVRAASAHVLVDGAVRRRHRRRGRPRTSRTARCSRRHAPADPGPGRAPRT